jgi:aldose 1-epimerase
MDAGPLRAAIDPALGATLTEFSIAGPCDDRYPIMRRAPAGPTDPAQGASFLMGPWTNRIRDARFRFNNHTHQLKPNFPDGTAIHGVLRDAPWRITDRSPVSARMVYDSRADETANFPFALGAVLRAELAPAELTLDLSITNLDDRPMPAGCGHHPYFPRTLMAAGEQVHLQAGVNARYPLTDCLPTGPAADDDTCRRLREGAPLGNPNLDAVFAGFDGRAVVTWPDSRVRLTIDCSPAFTHLVVFTPRLRPEDPDSPPLPWFCVEPCTMANDGFNGAADGAPGTGVVTLESGQTLDTTVRFHVERL